jgi:hypothetical protein
MKKFHFLGVRNQPIIQASVRLSAGRPSAGRLFAGRLSAGPPTRIPAPVRGASRADETR